MKKTRYYARWPYREVRCQDDPSVILDQDWSGEVLTARSLSTAIQEASRFAPGSTSGEVEILQQYAVPDPFSPGGLDWVLDETRSWHVAPRKIPSCTTAAVVA